MLAVTNSIEKDFRELKPHEDWSFRSAGRSQTSAFTHAYHRYPAKFIPQIARRLIEDYAPNSTQVVCDPFGGCGTTLVEAKMSGHESIGFDINPVAKLITQTKTTPIKPRSLQNYRKKFLGYYDEAPSVSSVHHPRIGYWFEEDMATEVDKIYFAIKRIKNRNVRRFLICSFSHNLKNCSRWLMKSIKPTIHKDKIMPNAKETFLRHLDSMIKKNEQFYSTLKDSG